jgi:DNA-binding CsgD family transcriptional regulator
MKYAEHYWRFDPLYPAQFSPMPENRVFKTDDIISYSRLKKLDYYREYLKQINWFGELVIRLCNDSGFLGTMSLSRSPKQPVFDRTDVQKAEFLLPYLINTFETADYLSKINEERKALEQWLELRQDGILLLDSRLKVLFSNSKGSKFCELISGFSTEAVPENPQSEFSLPALITKDCKRLLDDSALNNNRIIGNNYGERYYLRYTLIGHTREIAQSPCIVVHLKDLTKPDVDVEAILLKDYELSEREETIAHYVGIGLTNKEIAKKLYISPFTVQNHIKNIFNKTGFKNRTQLANLMKCL